MARRRYLVAYDIREPKRLRRTFELMKGYGEHLQYSVFLCDLDGMERSRMRGELAETIDHRVDSVAVVDLGLAVDRGSLCFEFMGVHKPLPEAGPRVL
jgi:CRISPR-associated protein Cas2